MIHTDLPIYRTGVQLMQLAVQVQVQLPREVKRHLGDKISAHCMSMLDEMALANATQREQRTAHIEQLLTHQRAVTVLLRVGHDARYVSHGLWAQSVQLLGSIGKQGGGWLKKTTTNRAPAA